MKFLSHKRSILIVLAAATVLGLFAWRGFFTGSKPSGKQEPAVALILDWYKYALEAERYSEGYRPPVAARVYAYLGLAAWEAARPVIGGGFQSLASRYEGLKLPQPEPTAH